MNVIVSILTFFLPLLGHLFAKGFVGGITQGQKLSHSFPSKKHLLLGKNFNMKRSYNLKGHLMNKEQGVNPSKSKQIQMIFYY